MSFMRTLASVAVGFAAAKGMDKYKEMGGMAGLQKMMQQGGFGGPGGGGAVPGMGDLGQMAEKMGLGGMFGAMQGGGPGHGAAGAGGTATNPLEQMMGALGGGTQAAGAAGLGGLMAAFAGAAEAGGRGMDDMMGALTGGTPASDAMEETAKLMLRAMIQAAKADGEIDADERAKILDQLGDVSSEERAFVEAELAKPLDVAGLAEDARGQMAAQVYAAALMAIHVDNRREAAYLDQLSTALGLPKDMRDRMHQAMGVPTP